MESVNRPETPSLLENIKSSLSYRVTNSHKEKQRPKSDDVAIMTSPKHNLQQCAAILKSKIHEAKFTPESSVQPRELIDLIESINEIVNKM